MHNTITKSKWNIQIWDQDEIQFGRNLLKELDELNTTKQVKPKQQTTKLNIITYAGLIDLAQRNLPTRSANHSTNRNDYHAVGTGSKLESLSDIALVNETGRKVIASSAESGGSERYATSFQSGEVSQNTISEAGIFTALTGGILIMRVTTDSPLSIGSTDTVTVSTTVSHSNGTEIP